MHSHLEGKEYKYPRLLILENRYLIVSYLFGLFFIPAFKTGFRLRVSPDPTDGYIVGYLEEAIPIL